MNDQVERPPRFTLTDRHALALWIEWADGGEPTTAAAVLLDISAGGVKLSLSSHLKLQQAISLRIVSAELKLDLTVAAKVCWLRPEENDHWAAGCAFVPELSPAALEILFDSGLVERRIFPRHPIKMAAIAQWELEPAHFDVELLDVSTGGVCIRSPRPGKIGSRLVVHVPASDGREVPISVRCQWQIAAETGYLAGCVYVNVEGHAAVDEALACAAPRPQPISRPSRWRRLVVGVAGSLALGWIAWHFGEAQISAIITRLLAQLAHLG